MFAQLGRQRNLFINDRWVEVGRSEARYGCHNLQRVLHQPQRKGLVVCADRPWESPVLEMLSNNVLVDAETGLHRMWYQCFVRKHYPPLSMEIESSYTAYAESEDGVSWRKPELGICEHNGSTANNICLAAPGCGVGWGGVLEDRDDPSPQRRFKMLGHGTVGTDHGTVIYFSPDGLRWSACPHNPVLFARVDCGDSPTLMGCRDPRSRRFVAAIRPQDWWLSYPQIPTYRYDRRHPQADDLQASCAYRTIGLSFSEDFTQWTIPQTVLAADLDDPPGTQIQGMTLCPYEGQYLGFLMMHYADGANDTIDLQLAVSDDLLHWQRVGGRRPFFPIGDEGPWTSRMLFAVSATLIRHGQELWLYYNAHRTTHYARHEDRAAAIGLARLRLDGFVSMHSSGPGFLVTKPFTFDGGQLMVNADTGRGSLRVQALDLKFGPIDGYETRPFRGDSTEQALAWPADRPLEALQGRPIRLKFLLEDADLYSFWIR